MRRSSFDQAFGKQVTTAGTCVSRDGLLCTGVRLVHNLDTRQTLDMERSLVGNHDPKIRHSAKSAVSTFSWSDQQTVNPVENRVIDLWFRRALFEDLHV